jgi:hypothetical protein
MAGFIDTEVSMTLYITSKNDEYIKAYIKEDADVPHAYKHTMITGTCEYIFMWRNKVKDEGIYVDMKTLEDVMNEYPDVFRAGFVFLNDKDYTPLKTKNVNDKYDNLAFRVMFHSVNVPREKRNAILLTLKGYGFSMAYNDIAVE